MCDYTISMLSFLISHVHTYHSFSPSTPLPCSMRPPVVNLTCTHTPRSARFLSSLHPFATCRKHSDAKKEEEKKKQPHIKKPLNAFMLYMKEMRAKVVAECTLKESAAINQILGRRVRHATTTAAVRLPDVRLMALGVCLAGLSPKPGAQHQAHCDREEAGPG